jgi:poly(A) polymerase
VVSRETVRLDLDGRTQALLRRLSDFLEARSVEAYATGGFLRDALLGVEARDVDVSVRADPRTVGPDIADEFGGSYFTLDEERRLARVMVPDAGMYIDLLPLEEEIEADLRRRDYTVDAMAAPLGEAAEGAIRLIDPTGGRADLDSRLVRAASETGLLEDPLRVLRGVRLATQPGFRLEPGTEELLRRHARLVAESAVERQRDEVMRIFSAPEAAKGVRLLESLGLLDVVMPEMSVTRGVEQPKEHYYDVLGHSFAAVEALDFMMSESEPEGSPQRELWRVLWESVGFWTEAREYFRRDVVMGTPRRAVLKLCGFLHDIGKPKTKTFEANGRMRFFGHSEEGAAIAKRLMRRMRFSSREVSLVTAMIEAHLRPVQMAQQGPPTRRAIYRFFRDTGEAGIDTLFLSLGDHLGTVGPRVSMEGWRQHVAVVAYVLEKRLSDEEAVSPPKLIRGDELMEELGVPPGPEVGRLLEAIREAQAAGEIATREEAVELARGMKGQTRD